MPLKQLNYNKITHHIVEMLDYKYTLIILSTLFVFTHTVEISVGRHDVSIVEKRKIYCSMMSYHFLDYDMDTFQAFTEGFSTLRSDAFKAKVASRLSQNCQQKITNQQLTELSNLVQGTKGHEQQIQTLQHKYIEFFTPEENIVLKLLQQVNHESEKQIKREIDNYHNSRKQIENYANKVAEGFRNVTQHINETTHHTVATVNKFMQSLLHLHGNVSAGWKRFSTGLMTNVESIKGNLSQTADKLQEHPHVQTVKGLWDSIWEEEL